MKVTGMNKTSVAAPSRKAFARASQQAHTLAARAQLGNVAVLEARSARGVAAAASRSSVQPIVASADGKKTVIITGTSSGLGLHAAKHLAASGDWHIIMANRDYSKTLLTAKQQGISRKDFTYLQCDLASLESVRKFVDEFRATGRSLDCLVCNAAVYLPVATEPSFTVEGFELSVGVNHLAHFLLANLLMPDLQKSDTKRMIIVGSITGNKNTLAGMIPPQADLGNLEGLEAGFQYPNVMINGGEFEGPKAYKDAKVCNMLTMREFDRRYAKDTGINFSSLYPGCIAETGLFRNHVKAFQNLFPVFQKNITQGYVSEDEAGRRLAAVVTNKDGAYNQSGAYWSWSNDSEVFVNTPSDEVSDVEKGKRLWKLSERLCEVEAPKSAAATVQAASSTQTRARA
eukprot:TRINITY_DN2405_c0_g1_i6.p2 TRINITY_DN2405_c0_g1~~TRINITY_DN2405_c0_g1_i6.p2  ORF type:complete len:401 (-),score=63.67 TRINITY_DN2405_c0_g1_i6:701-1903(-)